MTSRWFLIHTELLCTVNHTSVLQADHILISNRFRSAITGIRVLRGPDIGSDHSLLKMHCKVKLRVKIGTKYNEKRKIENIF